jgi:hypothetical protein
MSITVDLWQTFELTSVTAAQLALNDNCASGDWTVNDASAFLSVTAGAERATLEQINSTSDTGSKGLQYSNTANNTTGNIQYDFAAGHDNISFGFWFQISTEFIGSYKEHDLLVIKNVFGNGESYVKIAVNNATDLEIVPFNPDNGYGSHVHISDDTWYWITVKHVRNDKLYLRVYDTSGAQVESEVSIALSADRASEWFSFGSYIGTDGAHFNETLLFDDLIVDWTDATFPLGPGSSSSIEQEGFRFRNDDGSEAAATWKANQDVNITLAADTAARIRMLLNATGDPASIGAQLEYRYKPSGGAFGPWTKVN